MLVEIFDTTSDDLRKEIQHTVNLENVISATNSTFHTIRSEIRNKELLHEPLLDRIIAHMKTSVLLILSASEVKVWKKEQQKRNVELIGKSAYHQTIKILQGLLLLGLIGLLLLLQEEYTKLLISLCAAVLLLELILYFLNVRYEHKQMKRSYKKIDGQGLEEVKYEVLVDPDHFIAALREVIISTDKLLPLLDHQDRGNPGLLIEKDKALMELFQGMVEATDNKDSELAFLSAKRIPSLLSKYQIKLVYYDGENDDYFDFFPNLKSNEVVTVYPALVKNDKVIAPGRALRPSISLK